ncbi:MAG: ABC transporter substrate-binding protein [Xanthobacteraceae bacterium]|jgi:putative ABC transport system substrate-binding protein
MRRRQFVGLVGSAVAWPVVARAQQPMPAIGLLTTTNLEDWVTRAIRKGLDETGYVEGRNLTIIPRSAGGQLDRLPTLAADLVSNRVSAILATGGPVPARAAKAVTTQIPIIFAYGGDPVADGLVASFNRPEGNVTGATFLGTALSGKRLELLREIAPQIMDVALLANPKSTLAESQIKDATAAAQRLGHRLHVINASSESEIDEAFVTMGRLKIDALLVSVDPLYGFVLGKKIVVLASHYNILAMYDGRSYVDSGGLMSYGPILSETWRQAGVYVGRILKGERPSDLPIIQPTKFEMVINLKAAKALGLEIPPKLLFTADEVIE